MAATTIEKRNRRNHLYRNMYPRVMNLLLASLLACGFFTIALFYAITHIPPAKLFATSVDSEVARLVPLEQPNQSSNAVLQWATQAAITMNTYDFVNYHRQLGAARNFFTAQGWTNFRDALDASQNIKDVVSKKLIVSAVATHLPVILAKGVMNGRYSWRVQLIMLVTFQSPGSSPTQQGNTVTMLIRRISTRENPRGIGIDQITIGPGPTPGVQQ